jgi:hypothetical protein
MRCPADKNDMIVVEHNRIELDYCHCVQGSGSIHRNSNC